MGDKEFSEKGFLSSYVYEHREDVRNRYSGAFSACVYGPDTSFTHVRRHRLHIISHSPAD